METTNGQVQDFLARTQLVFASNYIQHSVRSTEAEIDLRTQEAAVGGRAAATCCLSSSSNAAAPAAAHLSGETEDHNAETGGHPMAGLGLQALIGSTCFPRYGLSRTTCYPVKPCAGRGS